jgi:hypothetical protein
MVTSPPPETQGLIKLLACSIKELVQRLAQNQDVPECSNMTIHQLLFQGAAVCFE